MLKKFFFICFYIPLSLNATNVSLSNELIAEQCLVLSNELNPIIEIQFDSICDTQLNIAKLHIDVAASEILSNRRNDSKDYLNLSSDDLLHTELYGCLELGTIHAVKDKVLQLIDLID